MSLQVENQNKQRCLLLATKKVRWTIIDFPGHTFSGEMVVLKPWNANNMKKVLLYIVPNTLTIGELLLIFETRNNNIRTRQNKHNTYIFWASINGRFAKDQEQV